MDVWQIEQILRALGARKTTIKGNKVRSTCLLAPWSHKSGRDEKPSMVVFPQGRHGDPIYSCQACHRKGSLRGLLIELGEAGQAVDTYLELLEKERGSRPFKPKRATERLVHTVEHITYDGVTNKREVKVGPWYDRLAVEASDKVPEIPWEVFKPYAGSVPRYAIDRGLTIETCKAWELGHDKKMRRLLFPMRDRGGRIVAISGRLYACPSCGSAHVATFMECQVCGALLSTDVCPCGGLTAEVHRCAGCKREQPPKYLHSDGFQRNVFLYGEHRRDGDDAVYVVEGHLDVVKFWQMGYRPVVGTLGTQVGESQAERLVKFWRRLIVVPDGDESGVMMGNLVKRLIADRIPVSVLKLPPKRDPGDLTDVEAREFVGEPWRFCIDKPMIV